MIKNYEMFTKTYFSPLKEDKNIYHDKYDLIDKSVPVKKHNKLEI